MTTSHPHFVPDNTVDNRHETAVLLVGTAREFNIHQRSIKAAQGGFWITDELAAVLYDDTEQVTVSGNDEPVVTETVAEDKPKPKAKRKSATDTSGDRAAKNEPTEE